MARGDLILAADFGTSGVKIGVVREGLEIIASAVEPYPLSLPGPSKAEQRPEDWWAALAHGIARLGSEVPDLGNRIGALVFCAQMCGLVCADEDGTPLRPSLIWLDKRSASLMAGVLGGWPRISGYGLGKLMRWLPVANGAPSHNGMELTGKMLWIKENEPGIFNRARWLMDVKDWLIHRATGEAATTADSANLTWMMDTRPGREGWSPRLAAKLGIPLQKLPRIVDGTAVAGGLTQSAARQLGLRAGTPVVAGGGDVSCTAIGSGAIANGELHLCISTSSWIAGFFDRRILSYKHSNATITSSVGFRPLLVATQESAGAALQWLAKELGPRRRGDEEELARFYSDLGSPQPDDPFFFPWLAGERMPVDEERLRGTFYGIALRHDLTSIKRSVIEGVALNTLWAYSGIATERDAARDAPIPLVGGAAVNPYLAQAIADALGRPVRGGEKKMCGVLGAAAMAAVEMGWSSDVWKAVRALNGREGSVFTPDPAHKALMEDRRGRLQEVRKGIVKLYRRNGGMTP